VSDDLKARIRAAAGIVAQRARGIVGGRDFTTGAQVSPCGIYNLALQPRLCAMRWTSTIQKRRLLKPAFLFNIYPIDNHG